MFENFGFNQRDGYNPEGYVSLRQKLKQLRQRVNPQDIINTRIHSRDFNNSRAEYISVRVRSLALVFALLAPIWIPIDYAVMTSSTFKLFLLLRVGFSLGFLALAMWGTRCNHLSLAKLRLAVFILIPGLFYFASHSLLPNNSDNHAIFLGYSFLPLLIMALLTIVPLTLFEGLFFTGLVTLTFCITQLFHHTLFTVPSMGKLWLLLLLAVIAIWVQLTQLHMLMRLYREATRDALTGLVNRRILSNKLNEEIAHHKQRPHAFCVMLFDLDLFKRINDNHGHHTGDHVLQAFADILRKYSSDTITIGRYGGEEFLAILPQCDIDHATVLAEQIRLACHDVLLYDSDGNEVRFTTSIGITQIKEGENAEQLLQRVDEGLYRAKAAGRDFVAVAY